MKRSRFSDEQISYAIKLAEQGTPVKDVCRQFEIAKATFYVWRKKFAGLGPLELQELRQLRRRERPAEDGGGGSDPGQAHLDRGGAKKALKPARRRELVGLDPRGFSGLQVAGGVDEPVNVLSQARPQGNSSCADGSARLRWHRKLPVKATVQN